MAINDKQNMGAVLIGLEIVANLIGRCAIYETLYIGNRTRSSIHFGEETVKLYACILLYLIRAKQYYSKNTGVRIAFSTFETELASLLDDIAAQETSLLKATDLAEAGCHRIASRELQEIISRGSSCIIPTS